MQFKKLNDILGKNQLLPINPTYAEIDPTEIIEHYFFERGKGDYRQETIDFMLKNKIAFHSTCNNNFDMAKRFLKVTCPKCGKEMKYSGGSGSSGAYTHRFECKRGCPTVSITIPSDGISISGDDHNK
jgi:predicted RNA-binding Zn-ribbon protein involved in translation (DUF1610 family)